MPERLAHHLDTPDGNLSLFYDRGFAGHGEGAQNGSSAKERFLETFQQVFAEQVGTGRDLAVFTERRERAMKAIGAEPRLAVDVLTPHFRDYYSDGSIPGDWGEPVPVPFLTVEVGTEIAFYFRVIDARSADDDVAKLTALLEQGLEQLGIGGKRSSGYGVFSSEPAPVAAAASAKRKNEKRHSEAKPAAKPKGDSLWTNAQLARGRSGIEANRGKRRASGGRDLVDQTTWSALKKGKKVIADVAVARVLGEYRIIKVENVRF